MTVVKRSRSSEGFTSRQMEETRNKDIQFKRPAEGEDHIEGEDRLLERLGPEKVGRRGN